MVILVLTPGSDKEYGSGIQQGKKGSGQSLVSCMKGETEFRTRSKHGTIFFPTTSTEGKVGTNSSQCLTFLPILSKLCSTKCSLHSVSLARSVNPSLLIASSHIFLISLFLGNLPTYFGKIIYLAQLPLHNPLYYTMQCCCL